MISINVFVTIMVVPRTSVAAGGIRQSVQSSLHGSFPTSLNPVVSSSGTFHFHILARVPLEQNN